MLKLVETLYSIMNYDTIPIIYIWWGGELGVEGCMEWDFGGVL